VSNNTGKQYIGSSCQKKLCSRLTGHVRKGNTCSSREIIEDGNYEIILIENFPCDSKDELHKRERYYIETLDCVNKVIPTRTQQEYYVANREQRKEYCKNNKEQIVKKKQEYYENNRGKNIEQAKEYYETNKERILEQAKEYYETNKERILEQAKEYHKNNREHLLEQMKKYKVNNKERIKQYQQRYREKKLLKNKNTD